MKTTKRFDDAVTKLYKAFHNNELQAMSCTACAVGNICDGKDGWHRAFKYNSPDAYFDKCIHEKKSPKWKGYLNELKNNGIIEGLYQNESGYSIVEIAKIEWLFMIPYLRSDEETKETQFNGLIAVVKYLCELDGIEDVTDFTKLFEYDNENKPKYQLN